MMWGLGGTALAAAGWFAYLKFRNPWLHGDYAPVGDELSNVDLRVTGDLPAALNGTYVRNGRNALYPCDGFSRFDGDGMVHAVRINQGKATYSNRFIETKAYLAEKAAGRSLFPCADLDKPSENRSAFSVVWHHNRLLSLSSNGGPYRLDPDTLRTLGPYDFDGQWKLQVSRCPAFDGQTGEMFFTGFSGPSSLKIGSVNADGRVRSHGEVEMKRGFEPQCLAVTKNFIILLRPPLFYKAGHREFRANWPMEVALVPRREVGGEPRWYNLTPCLVDSILNAFDDGQTITIYGVKDAKGAAGAHDVNDQGDGEIKKWQISLARTGTIEFPLSTEAVAYPTLNPKFAGRESRFGYFGRRSGALKTSAACKYDFVENKWTTLDLDSHCYGGEFRFVPDPSRGDKEDGGWLLGFVCNERTLSSYLQVIDAETMKDVARVHLTRRVPYGLLGTWIPRSSV